MPSKRWEMTSSLRSLRVALDGLGLEIEIAGETAEDREEIDKEGSSLS
jgi:hypothetical protein